MTFRHRLEIPPPSTQLTLQERCFRLVRKCVPLESRLIFPALFLMTATYVILIYQIRQVSRLNSWRWLKRTEAQKWPATSPYDWRPSEG